MEEIKNLQNQVDEWIRNVGLRYFSELTNMAILTEEVGEVARIIARRYGEQSEKESDKSKDLGQELADVLFVILCIANQTGINLHEAFNKNLDFKTKRDKQRHQNNEKLHSHIPLCEMVGGETINIGGSKSITNRLLILKKIFKNINLENISTSQDSKLLVKALENENSVVDVHHAGTSMRFLTSYFATTQGKSILLTGSDRMKNRPIKPLVDALKQIGADIEYAENKGFPPLKIIGKEIEKKNISIPANISSQFITSLLLIGASLKNGLIIKLEGKITSKPYIMMTIGILKKIGIEVSMKENIIEIKSFNKIIEPIKYTIESDWSSASYFYSLCAIGRKKINLKNFSLESLQADSKLVDIYKSFFGIETIKISDNEISLKPIENFKFRSNLTIDLNDCPDIAQTICVTAVALDISFYITGLETLKVKETDRLIAMQSELRKIGQNTEITDFSIKSTNKLSIPKYIKISTYNDHRMAMSFAPFALIYSLEIENPSVVEKSYPEFWNHFYKVVRRTK